MAVDLSNASKKGKRLFLTLEDEKYLAEWISRRSQSGNRVTAVELLDVVKARLDKGGIISRFANNRPSLGWVRTFKKRHNLPLVISTVLAEWRLAKFGIPINELAPVPATNLQINASRYFTM